jgi:hypothetical protein
MATRTTYVVVDDLDGSTDAVTTRRFTVDGVDYEIDLSPANSATFDQVLGPYLSAARRLPRSRKPHRRRGAAGGSQ